MNKLFILVGPSAAGKTLISNFLVHKDVNILQNLINVVNDLDKSSMLENLNIAINTLEKSPFNKIITSTSRPPREKEIHGVDYYFYNKDEFEKKISNDDFLEYVENFGNYYGTCLKSINNSLNIGNSIIVLDDKGAIKMKELLKSQAITIYLDIPVDVMEKRMNFRNDDPASMLTRTTNLHIMSYKNKADFIINVNKRIDFVLLDIIEIIKNKVASPFKQAEFDIMYNEGISKEGNLVDIGVNEEIVQKSGAWFAYNDIRLGQGRENAKIYLKENPEIALEIENKIRAKHDLPLCNEQIYKDEK